MTTRSHDWAIEDFLREFSDKKYYIDKKFQRNLVWDKKKKTKYIQSVSNGCASSSMIAADIKSSLEASVEAYGVEHPTTIKLKNYQAKGLERISLDGMQRRQTIQDYVKGEFALNVKLKKGDGTEFNAEGILFPDLPYEVQLTFLKKTVHVVEHYHTPYKECARIFRMINDGAALTAQEKRTAIDTPISQEIRQSAEVEYNHMWTRIEGFDQTKISRMENSELLSGMYMHLAPELKEKDLNITSHIDKFYECGEDCAEIKDVIQYEGWSNSRKIIEMMMKVLEHQREFTKKSKIPKKNMWAVLYACEYIYAKQYEIVSEVELFKKIRNIDGTLEANSRLQQNKVIQDLQSETNQETGERYTPEEAIDHPSAKSNNFYWRWINRNAVHKWRQKRIECLHEKFSEDFNVWEIEKIIAKK
jgi:hypothetical protein